MPLDVELGFLIFCIVAAAVILSIVIAFIITTFYEVIYE